jgi:hypothetical protein
VLRVVLPASLRSLRVVLPASLRSLRIVAPASFRSRRIVLPASLRLRRVVVSIAALAPRRGQHRRTRAASSRHSLRFSPGS